jgi:AraC-like DNA-binding protein
MVSGANLAKPTVIALLQHAWERNRLRAAVDAWLEEGPRARMVVVDSWAALHLTVRVTARAVVVVDPFGFGDASFSALRMFLSEFPSVPALAYADLRTHPVFAIIALARLKLVDIVAQGASDDPKTFGFALTNAMAMGNVGTILSKLEGAVSEDALLIWRHALLAIDETLTPSVLARQRGMHVASLRRDFRRVGLPSPERFIIWCRLFAAADMLGDRGRTLTDVAAAVGCSSSACLANHFKRYVGMPTTEVLRRGGLDFVITVFAERALRGCASLHERWYRQDKSPVRLGMPMTTE